MLGGEDDTLHTCLLAYPSPLPTIEVAWIEQFRVFISKAPFLIGVRVHRIVDKRIHLHLLPTQLILRRHRTARFRTLSINIRNDNA